MDLRVIHHLMAHTIGQRKSSHGIVNTFEILFLYTVVSQVRINVGYQIAKYMFRQVDDPRVKGLYCGGYVTKLLKGLEIFQAPAGDPGKPSTTITNGPFSDWNLVKVDDRIPRYPHNPGVPLLLPLLLLPLRYHHKKLSFNA